MLQHLFPAQKINNNSNSLTATHDLFLFSCALFWGLLINNVGWTIYEVSPEIIYDRGNYINYANYSLAILIKYTSSLTTFLVNEPIWLLLNNILFVITKEPQTVVSFFIVCSITFISYTLLKQGQNNWLFIFFLLFTHPVIISSLQIRQGFAVSLFLWAIFSTSKLRFVVFMALPFIHSSFFFTGFILGIIWFLKKIHISYYSRLFIIFIVSIVIAMLFDTIISFLGARQSSQYGLGSTDISGVGLFFWFCIFLFFHFKNRKINDRYLFLMASFVFYFVSYFTMEVSARIFQNVVLLIILFGLQFKGNNKVTFKVLITLFIGLSTYKNDTIITILSEIV